MSNDRVSLIAGKEWASSLKNLGLTITDAVCELVDNSLDAGAQTVHVTVYEPSKKKITFVIEDDGMGIPMSSLATVLAFGGRLESNRQTIGKFGWGLSSAITCITDHGELYSKTESQKEWGKCYIDIDELKKEATPILPVPKIADPAAELPLKLGNLKHGTIVVLRDCNAEDLEWHKKEKIVSELTKTLAETYRRHIQGGISFFVNETLLQPVDPLLLMTGAIHEGKYARSKLYKEIAIEMPDIMDSATGAPAKVRIKLAMLDPTVTEVKDKDKAVSIGMKNQGFYLMRNDRQIERAQTFNLYTRNSHMNFLRGEISFPICLDKYFGIQTNKSRYTLKEGLLDKMKEALKGVMEQMEKEYYAARAEYKKTLEKYRIRESEKIAAEAIRVMRRARTSVSKVELEKQAIEREKEKNIDLQRIERDETLQPEEKEIIKKEILNDFQKRMPLKVRLVHYETGNFYLIKPVGNNEVEVHINTAHPFYRKVYERAQEKGLADYLDLLLFTLAKAELDYWDTDTKQFYEQQKAVWSGLLSAFLGYAD